MSAGRSIRAEAEAKWRALTDAQRAEWYDIMCHANSRELGFNLNACTPHDPSAYTAALALLRSTAAEPEAKSCAPCDGSGRAFNVELGYSWKPCPDCAAAETEAKVWVGCDECGGHDCANNFPDSDACPCGCHAARPAAWRGSSSLPPPPPVHGEGDDLP